MTTEAKKLATELDFFEANRKVWLAQNASKFAVVRNRELLGFYDDFESALNAGLEKCDLGEFLVKQVLEEEPIYAIF